LIRFYRGAAITFFLFIFSNWGNTLSADTSTPREFFNKHRGPIAIRNQMPLYLFYLQMAPDKAEITEKDKLSINAAYTVSNITASAFTPGTSLYDIQIDAEVSRVTLDFRYGFGDKFEAGLEIPYISLSRGYLDNLIEGIEDGIGARTPRSREKQGSYNFNYSLRYNSRYLINETHSKEGLGDIVFNLKYQLLEDENFLPNLSVRSAVKLPTAEEELLGSKKADYGIGLLIDKYFMDKLFIYAGFNAVFIEKPDLLDQLDLKKHILSGMMAAEYFLNPKFSLILQLSGNTSPYPTTGTNVLDNNAYELGMGFNYGMFHFAFIENIKSASSPDAGFHMGLKWEF
jgi:hypothetical protein